MDDPIPPKECGFVHARKQGKTATVFQMGDAIFPRDELIGKFYYGYWI
jgi:hypothetical protein